MQLLILATLLALCSADYYVENLSNNYKGETMSFIKYEFKFCYLFTTNKKTSYKYVKDGDNAKYYTYSDSECKQDEKLEKTIAIGGSSSTSFFAPSHLFFLNSIDDAGCPNADRLFRTYYTDKIGQTSGILSKGNYWRYEVRDISNEDWVHTVYCQDEKCNTVNSADKTYKCDTCYGVTNILVQCGASSLYIISFLLAFIFLL
ncbi:hypothetical protein EIN_171350 [Entamoeba invadens IP1]|uniref:Uncharacterized protein n=2 Tax=Entamoeba invadens TaxID=33085 RepID=A0A0A1TYE3_ENTIV|nr:hypothetical protein EIN_171350 [Entamoeba invadens IP1]ELP84570.1 hypothetical protein EIN_171350 [Entamoeba invadens IP1]BAN40983.1 hypothetical protein [Entamoeba invadens]|eukprot:XP_004183916.1 hypothetical protein EIN_171350 [Entamoeba invadens IP1]